MDIVILIIKILLQKCLENLPFGFIFCFGTQLFICNYYVERGYKINKYAGGSDTSKKRKNSILFNFLFNTLSKIAFIPIVNILVPCIFLIKTLINETEYSINYLSSNNQLIPLTFEETQKYKNNPNIITSYKLNLNEVPIKRNLNISYHENGIKNIIYFDLFDKDYIITKTIGPISNFSDIEQRAKFINNICAITKCNMDSDDEEFAPITAEEMKKLSIPEQKNYFFGLETMLCNKMKT